MEQVVFFYDVTAKQMRDLRKVDRFERIGRSVIHATVADTNAARELIQKAYDKLKEPLLFFVIPLDTWENSYGIITSVVKKGGPFGRLIEHDA